MKILKKIGIVLLVLIVLISVTSLFFPTTTSVEKSTTIEAPVQTVFNNVNSMANWQKWGGPWHEEGMDYNEVIQRIEGPVFGVGSKLIYDQGKGDGSVAIIESDESKKLKTLISFADGGSANGVWLFEQRGSTTKVTWTIQVQLGYNPLKRIIGNLVMENHVGPLFEIGLNNLKNISED